MPLASWLLGHSGHHLRERTDGQSPQLAPGRRREVEDPRPALRSLLPEPGVPGYPVWPWGQGGPAAREEGGSPRSGLSWTSQEAGRRGRQATPTRGRSPVPRLTRQCPYTLPRVVLGPARAVVPQGQVCVCVCTCVCVCMCVCRVVTAIGARAGHLAGVAAVWAPSCTGGCEEGAGGLLGTGRTEPASWRRGLFCLFTGAKHT